MFKILITNAFSNYFRGRILVSNLLCIPIEKKIAKSCGQEKCIYIAASVFIGLLQMAKK